MSDGEADEAEPPGTPQRDRPQFHRRRAVGERPTIASELFNSPIPLIRRRKLLTRVREVGKGRAWPCGRRAVLRRVAS